MNLIFFAAYIAACSIFLAFLFFKHKYRFLGLVIYFFALCTIYILLQTVFNGFDIYFSVKYFDYAKERMWLVPFVSHIMHAIRFNIPAIAVIIYYLEYLFLGATLSIAFSLLYPQSTKVIKILIILNAILLVVVFFVSCFSLLLYDAGIFVVLFIGLISGHLITKNIKKKLLRRIILI